MTTLIKQAQIQPLNTLQTKLGQLALYKGFEKWTNNKQVLDTRANTILCLQRILKEQRRALREQFAIIHENEDIFAGEISNWIKLSEQIFFETGSYGEVFNQTRLISFLTALKIWIAPLCSVISPLILFILPYFILVYVYNKKITWVQYQTIVLKTCFGGIGFDLNSITKILYFIISISQTVIQPFFTAIAVHRLDTLVKEISNKLRICILATEKIFKIYSQAGIKVPVIPIQGTDPYLLFAQYKDEPWKINQLGQMIGHAEVLYSIAIDSRFKKPIWTKEVHLTLNHFADICISDADTSSVTFHNKRHAILTGPNRGGKSSNLRGMLQAVLWAQSYGVTPCEYKGCIFDWMEVSLSIEDRPGISSLFEREIEIATDILKHTQGIGFVLIDELFHSTNPPDAEKTATIFLNALWKMPNIISCISTHIYSLAETAPEQILRLCVMAEEHDGHIYYDYRIQEGICKISSVSDVLREKGLLEYALKF